MSSECETLKQSNIQLLETQRQLVRQKEVENNRHTDNTNELARA